MKKRWGAMRTKTDHKRVLIFESAKRLFSKYGLKKTSVDEIAADAHIAKGTIYNYFRTKEEIFSVIVKEESDLLIKKISNEIKAHKTARDQIKAAVTTKLSYYKETAIFYDISQAVIKELMPDMRKLREDYFKKEEEILEKIIKKGVLNKEIRKIRHVDMVAKSIIISLKEIESPLVFEKSKKEVETMLNTMLDILFFGIAAK